MSERKVQPGASAHSTGESGNSGTGRSLQRLRRLLLAASVTVFTGLASGVFWAVARAQYLNDYCTTRAPKPHPDSPEALGGRPAYLSDPMTVRCEYDGFPNVDVHDPLPLLGALVLVVLVSGVAVLMFRWARRPTHG